MLTHGVDIAELKNNPIFKKRFSLQQGMRRTPSDGSGSSPLRAIENNNMQVDSNNITEDTENSSNSSSSDDDNVEPTATNGIAENNHDTRAKVSNDPEPATAVSAPSGISRSISTGMMSPRFTMMGLFPRPASLTLAPEVLVATSKPETATNPEAADAQTSPDIAGEVKKKKGILSSVSRKKLKEKFEKMATAKNKNKSEDKDKDKDKEKDKEKDKVKEKRQTKERGRSVRDFLLSPRSSSELSPMGSPESSSPDYLSPSTIRRASVSGTPSSPSTSVRHLFGDDIRGSYGSDDSGNSTPPEGEGGEAPRRGKKLENFFGDVPTNVYDRKMALNCDDDEEIVDIQEEGISYNQRKKKDCMPIIKGATVQKLIEKLTHHSGSDPNFMTQFLLTYRSFTTPQGLLDLLKARFEQVIDGPAESIGAGDGSSAENNAKYKQVIRLRLFNLVKSWLQHHWVDFQDGDELVGELLRFSDLITRDDMNMTAKNTLVRIVTKNKEGEKQKTLIFSQPPPKVYPLPAGKTTKLALTDIHPEEFARQITILEYEAFKAIKPWELLTHTLGKKCANIVAFINRFNELSKWVQTEILKAGETPKQRALAFGRLLEICEHLRNLNNFNALMEIISGINASPIFRLKMTWAVLGSKQLESLSELNTMLSGNGAYKLLRNTLHTSKPPCIPYMGMYLTDLTFIHDGNPTYLENGYINFDKCRRVAAVIQEVVQYQQTPYCLLTVDAIQQYLKTLDFERDEKQLYAVSLLLEEKK